MPLPEGFSEWKNLQYSTKKAHNDSVREFFRSQPDDDITTPKASLKHACLMKDDDTTAMTTLRMWLYWVMCRKMRDNFEPYPGLLDFNIEPYPNKFKPVVTLRFLEDFNDIESTYPPVRGEIKIRLVNEVSGTISQNDLQLYAERIKDAFAQNNGYVWQKGKDNYCYADKQKGYYFQILARNESDAVEIIRKMLSINSDTYDSAFLTVIKANNPSSAFPTYSPEKTILGKKYRGRRKRPIADVRFLYASVKIHGLPKPIILVDLTGHFSKAIISI